MALDVEAPVASELGSRLLAGRAAVVQPLHAAHADSARPSCLLSCVLAGRLRVLASMAPWAALVRKALVAVGSLHLHACVLTTLHARVRSRQAHTRQQRWKLRPAAAGSCDATSLTGP